MSSSKNHPTIFVHLHLGRASDYDPTVFPLVRKKTALKAGELYLEYTLDEIIKIREFAKKQPNYRTRYQAMKRRYDELAEDKQQIQEQKKTLNLFKALARARQNRLFIESSFQFKCEVKNTSDMMRRHTELSSSQFSVVSDGVVAVERGDSSMEQRQVSGIAIKCDRDLDDQLRGIIEEAASILTQPDPFDDSAQVANDSVPPMDSASTSTSSAGASAGASRSNTSSNITNVTYIENCHISSSSVSGVDIRSPTLKRLSINAGNHHNDGAVTQNAGSASFSESP